MSLCISSSDSASWARWLVTFLSILALGTALVMALVMLVDPYDSGRFGWLGINGVSDESPRTANASRGRDPQFDSAILGNSTGQLLNPTELSRASGARFVQLTVPGTGPREQLALLQWFARHHKHIGAIVVVTDNTWCTEDAALPPLNPFPFWLYGDSDLTYLGRLFSARALGRTMRRLALGLGWRAPSAPDGYWNYELLGHGEFRPAPPPPEEVVFSANTATPKFPAIDRLDGVIRKLEKAPIVLVMPPLIADSLPRPGARGDVHLRACKAALSRLVAERSFSNFLDFRVDAPLTRDPGNFLDAMHYRARVARRIEERIIESIRLGNVAPTTF